VGTSLPELFTSLVAALKGNMDISVGNIIGSNLFNILFIIGASGITKPLSVDPSILSVDLPVMLASAIILIPMMDGDHIIDRKESVILIVCYVFFVIIKLIP
jgi:cation:H+ antiporter